MQLIKGQNASQNVSEMTSNLTEIRFRPGGFAPWSPYQGLALDPLGA